MTDHKRKARKVTPDLQNDRTLALLEGIILGQQALADGRTCSHEKVMARTAKWA